MRLWLIRRLIPGYAFHAHAWAAHSHEHGDTPHSHSGHLTTPSHPNLPPALALDLGRHVPHPSNLISPGLPAMRSDKRLIRRSIVP